MSIYGESYGTQYVQTYAAAHPDAVKVLFTDGPVDLAMSGEAFYVEGVQAFENALAATLLDCTDQAACSARRDRRQRAHRVRRASRRSLPRRRWTYTFTGRDGSPRKPASSRSPTSRPRPSIR